METTMSSSVEECQEILLKACQQELGSCKAKGSKRTLVVDHVEDVYNFSLQCTYFRSLDAVIYSVAGSAEVGRSGAEGTRGRAAPEQERRLDLGVERQLVHLRGRSRQHDAVDLGLERPRYHQRPSDGGVSAEQTPVADRGRVGALDLGASGARG